MTIDWIPLGIPFISEPVHSSGEQALSSIRYHSAPVSIRLSLFPRAHTLFFLRSIFLYFAFPLYFIGGRTEYRSGASEWPGVRLSGFGRTRTESLRRHGAIYVLCRRKGLPIFHLHRDEGLLHRVTGGLDMPALTNPVGLRHVGASRCRYLTGGVISTDAHDAVRLARCADVS